MIVRGAWLLVAVALATLVAPSRARAIDIDGVILPLRAAEDAYERAWRSCFNLRDSFDTVIAGCDRDALQRAYDDYEARRRSLCTRPLPRVDPFTQTTKRSWDSDEFDALKMKQTEFRLWVELCSWTDRGAARASNLFTWNKGSTSMNHEPMDATIAEAVYRKLRRMAPGDAASWWYPYQRYASRAHRLCRSLAKHGPPEYGALKSEEWAKRCAAPDLAAFALDPTIFPDRKPGGSGGPSLEDLIGDGAATGGGGPPGDAPPPTVTTPDPKSPPVPQRVQLRVTLAGRDPGTLTAIPVPAELELVVTGVDADTGEPARLVNVDVSFGDARVPFARVDDGKKLAWSRLDDSGRYVTKLIVRAPRRYDDYLRLNELPLTLPLEVSLKRDDGTRLAQRRWERPFNLALYHGVTVGPDMEPRDVGGPPAFEMRPLQLAAESYEDGAFAVLVSPSLNRDLAKDPTLSERKLSYLFLVWPDELLLRLPVAAPKYGARFDVGVADALSASEHEERLRAAVRAFVGDMGLSAAWKKDVLDDLASVRFEYDPNASGGDTLFKDGLNGGGRISIPYAAEAYWARAVDDELYANVLHELGHWLHKRVVERHPWLHVVHAKLRAGAHKTWEVDASTAAFKRPFVAWMEATAEAFAYLAFAHWERRVPELLESPYHVRGYLDGFADDSAAIAALKQVRRGDQVEGLHTRYWIALYGAETKRRPARVFADILATMIQFTDDPDNWEGGIHAAPARTIDRWIWTKASFPSHLGVRVTGDPYAVAARYRLIPEGDPAPTLGVLGESPADVAVEVGGAERELSKTPVLPVDPGVRVRVLRGPVTLDVSSAKTRMMVRLETGAVVVVRGPGLVALVAGGATAVGPVSIVTPSSLAQATGTVFSARVADDGGSELSVLSGHVRVDGRGAGQRLLAAGQRVQVPTAGAVGEPSAFTLPPPRPRAGDLGATFVAGDPDEAPRDVRAFIMLGLGLLLWGVAAALAWRRRRARAAV